MEKDNIALPSCASLSELAGPDLWLAHRCFLLLTRLDSSHAPVVHRPAGLMREDEDETKQYASSGILFFFSCRFWTSYGTLCFWLLVVRRHELSATCSVQRERFILFYVSIIFGSTC